MGMGLGQIDKITSYKVDTKQEMLVILQERSMPDTFQRLKYDIEHPFDRNMHPLTVAAHAVNPNTGCIYAFIDNQDDIQMVPLYLDIVAARLDTTSLSSPSASQALAKQSL